mmetsp:Transcript_83691/g.223848  ORF Transcript_83691/g.223848 Transcript_83691/m.223848 type:complete len:313 (-) Transcript_83691:8-946(-)
MAHRAGRVARHVQGWTPTQGACMKLRDGSLIPVLGFGTYKVPAEDVGIVLADALDVGYRLFDCAKFYGNEAAVGAAIKMAGIPRDELYIVSKVWTDAIAGGAAAVVEQFERTCADLGLDYLDLYLIHWPVPGKHVEAYKALESLKDAGRIRALGISNYTIEDYQELMQSGVKYPPVVNQIEINPFLHRQQTIRFFEEQGVVMQAYRALRTGKAMEHPAIVRIARARGKTPAKVLGRWAVQQGYLYIPKSTKRARMEENADVLSWALTDREMSELDQLTSEENLQEYADLYRKCVIRDTPLGPEAVPSSFTVA